MAEDKLKELRQLQQPQLRPPRVFDPNEPEYYPVEEGRDRGPNLGYLKVPNVGKQSLIHRTRGTYHYPVPPPERLEEARDMPTDSVLGEMLQDYGDRGYRMVDQSPGLDILRYRAQRGQLRSDNEDENLLEEVRRKMGAPIKTRRGVRDSQPDE